MAIADRNGLPVSIITASASPHEVKLVEQTIDGRFVDNVPGLIIGDRAYDSDPLDTKTTAKYGSTIVAHTKTTASSQRPKMPDNLDDTLEDGELSVYLPGFRTIAELLHVGSGTK
jgi:hypothetical protein